MIVRRESFFFEVYLVSIFYGLESSAALVILTKFAFTPSVFIANSFLAYVAPILYAKSEIVSTFAVKDIKARVDIYPRILIIINFDI